MKIFVRNKRAKFDYTTISTIEAGLMLIGSEVNAIRHGKVSIEEAYVVIKKGELWLTGCHITSPSYASNQLTVVEKRDRKLLVHKRDIIKFQSKIREKGLTLIINNIYQPENSKKIKCEIALAKGKRVYDKRQALKSRDINIEMNRSLKKYS